MRVLVVEDDEPLGLFLQKGLQRAGHEVDWVEDGEAALLYVEARPPALMVLDLCLPRLDGTEVLAQVRSKYKDVSVLVVTGRSDVEERIRCLDLGADDFVMKPFSFHEVIARCKGILRRREQRASPMLRHGDIEMNRMDRSVQRDGQDIDLTAKEYALLEFMLLRGGECCTRSELLHGVWRIDPHPTTNIVDVYVNYLRKKLAVTSPGAEVGNMVIETVRGTGYRLNTGSAFIPNALFTDIEIAVA